MSKKSMKRKKNEILRLILDRGILFFMFTAVGGSGSCALYNTWIYCIHKAFSMRVKLKGKKLL